MKCQEHDACIYADQEGCLKDKYIKGKISGIDYNNSKAKCDLCNDIGKVIVHGVIETAIEVKCECQI